MLHYYGDLVRRFFFLGAVIMLATFPFFKEFAPIPVSISSFIVIAITLAAAVTNPASQTVAWLNVIVSALAVMFFEYYAVQALSLNPLDIRVTWYFWTNHVLALDFICALYFSAKTLRGMML